MGKGEHCSIDRPLCCSISPLSVLQRARDIARWPVIQLLTVLPAHAKRKERFRLADQGSHQGRRRVKEGEAGPVALDQDLSSDDLAERRLVKLPGEGYDRGHEGKLLSKDAVRFVFLLCPGVFLFVQSENAPRLVGISSRPPWESAQRPSQYSEWAKPVLLFNSLHSARLSLKCADARTLSPWARRKIGCQTSEGIDGEVRRI